MTWRLICWIKNYSYSRNSFSATTTETTIKSKNIKLYLNASQRACRSKRLQKQTTKTQKLRYKKLRCCRPRRIVLPFQVCVLCVGISTVMHWNEWTSINTAGLSECLLSNGPFKADILTCHCREGINVINEINDRWILFSCFFPCHAFTLTVTLSWPSGAITFNVISNKVVLSCCDKSSYWL